MRSRDVDIDAKTWTHTQGKTGDVSVTPLSAPAVEILRNRLDEEYVFPVRGDPVNQKALSVALFASRQAGVYNVYAYADEMRKWLDWWAEHVAGIAAPRAKPARAKR